MKVKTASYQEITEAVKQRSQSGRFENLIEFVDLKVGNVSKDKVRG